MKFLGYIKVLQAKRGFRKNLWDDINVCQWIFLVHYVSQIVSYFISRHPSVFYAKGSNMLLNYGSPFHYPHHCRTYFI